jgi:hypothetical protein
MARHFGSDLANRAEPNKICIHASAWQLRSSLAPKVCWLLIQHRCSSDSGRKHALLTDDGARFINTGFQAGELRQRWTLAVLTAYKSPRVTSEAVETAAVFQHISTGLKAGVNGKEQQSGAHRSSCEQMVPRSNNRCEPNYQEAAVADLADRRSSIRSRSTSQ